MDSTAYFKELKHFFGSSDIDTCTYFLNQLGPVLHPTDEIQKSMNGVNQTLPIIRAIAPQDELEGMLAVQMVGIHTMSMEMMKRAMVSGQTVEGVNYNVNRVTKLSRTFIAQMEALNKHRGKGKQKITVEHITVNEGGQAIVGNVEHGGGGRSENKK
ncbi:MAG: hypothetical protein KAI39_07010 [Desulfobulbaceae bacterium]|nr:hypothetical protein [Desulfobulbaceae bacterium]